MCKVSIIIPCYNVDETLLERCLNSIDSQTFSDYEVIIVDDGSKLEFQKIYGGLKEKHRNISIFHQNNKGVSAARNFGLIKSEGEYVLYIDADDYLTSSYLNESVKVAEIENADIVIGMNVTTYTKELISLSETGSGEVHSFEENDIKKLNKWMLGRIKHQKNGSYLGQGPWNRLVRRKIAMCTQFIEGMPVGEDIVWNLQLLQKKYKVCLVDKVWYVYYMNPGSATRKYRENAIKESYDSLIEMAKYIDLEDDEQYFSYCLRCWSDLKRIYRCYLSHNMKGTKKKRIFLFTNGPWNVLAAKRFRKLCTFKNKFMWILYRSRFLFKYYQVKEMMGKFSI